MSLKELRKVFMEEGVDGLATYEVLSPAYLNQNTDILGMPDVDNLGRKVDNNKIIVVQGFSVHDILTKTYSDKILLFASQEDRIHSMAREKKLEEYNEELKYQLTASINTQIQMFNALESSIKKDAKQQKRKGIAIGSSLGIGLSLTLGLDRKSVV